MDVFSQSTESFAVVAAKPGNTKAAEVTVRTEINEKGQLLFIKTGEFRYPNGDRFVGQTINEKRHGYGTLYFVNGDAYIGGFKHGAFDGFGTYSGATIRIHGVEKRGLMYHGDWLAGQKHGKGELVDKNGDHYEGDFESNKFHGYGVMRYADGRTYNGNWVSGLWHGNGRLFHKNGDSYVGQFSMGRCNGQGMFRYGAGGSYAGEWSRDARHGVGRRVWANGAEYEGEWRSDKRCGRGIYKAASGDIYVGMFDDDRYHGEGILVMVDGKRFHGSFARGVFSGMGSFKHTDGSMYVGEYNAQLRCGVTVHAAVSVHDLSSASMLYTANKLIKERAMKGPDGAQASILMQMHEQEKNPQLISQLTAIEARSGHMIVGTDEDRKWMAVHGVENPRTAPAMDGRKHGRGTHVWASGNRYEGEWFQDKMHGSGKYTTPLGETYDGDWNHGTRHGKGRAEFCNGGDSYVCALGFSHDGNGCCVYDGDWEDGKMDGYGTFTCADGRQHRGHWRNGLRHGHGVLVMIPPSVKGMGTHQIDDAGRIWSCTFTAVREYRGEFYQGKRQGEGSIILVNGDELHGKFVDNKLHGVVRYEMKSLGKEVYANYHHGKRTNWITGNDRRRIELQRKRPDLWELLGDKALDTWVDVPATETRSDGLPDTHHSQDKPVRQQPMPRVHRRQTAFAPSEFIKQKVKNITRATMDSIIPFRKPRIPNMVGIAKGTVKLSPLLRSKAASSSDASTNNKEPKSPSESQPFAFKPPAWLNELD